MLAEDGHVLRFLRTQLCTDSAVVQALLPELSLPAILAVFCRLEQQGCVKRYKVPQHSRVLWSITQLGQQWACTNDEEPSTRVLRTQQIGAGYWQHRLAVQKLVAIAHGIGWVVCAQESARLSPAARPDAILQHSQCAQWRCAVEYERTIKTPQRYVSILSERLQAIRRGEYHCVVWVCVHPVPMMRLERLLKSITAVPIAGTFVGVQPQKHHQKLLFCLDQQWPLCLQQYDWVAREGKE